MRVTIETIATAKRTDAFSGEERDTIVTIRLRDTDYGKVLEIVRGGVTGYESFYLDHYMGLRHSGHLMNGWLACAGTKNRWDKLEISESEMVEALTRLGLIGGERCE